MIQSALDGIVPADHIFGTELEYDPGTGEVRSIRRVPAGYGKVAVVEELESAARASPPDRTIYIGDGSSDVHVMLHVNNRDGFTIAVSENQQLARIAQEHRAQRQRVQRPGADARARRRLAVSRDPRRSSSRTGCALHEWEKARTDRVTIRDTFVVRHSDAVALSMRSAAWSSISGGPRRRCSSARISARAPEMLRRVQMVGALMWVAYGVVMHAAPVVVANLLVLCAAAWTATRQRPDASVTARS